MQALRAKESTRSAKAGREKIRGRFQAWEEGGVYGACLQLPVF